MGIPLAAIYFYISAALFYETTGACLLFMLVSKVKQYVNSLWDIEMQLITCNNTVTGVASCFALSRVFILVFCNKLEIFVNRL